MGNRFEKDPWEKFYIYGSIYNVAESGDAISLSGSSVEAVDKSNADATSEVLDSTTKALADDDRGGSDNMLKILTQAGKIRRSPYTITFKLATDAGCQYEIDAKMVVREEEFTVSTTTTSTTSTTTTTTAP